LAQVFEKRTQCCRLRAMAVSALARKLGVAGLRAPARCRSGHIVFVLATAVFMTAASIATTYCERTFAAHGLSPFAAVSLSKRHAAQSRGLRPSVGRFASDDSQEADSLMSKASELKEEAAAMEALAAARRRLKEERDRAQKEEEEENIEKEAVDLQQRLHEVSERLRRAVAFKTPEEAELRDEVKRIERRLDEVAQAVRVQKEAESKASSRSSTLPVDSAGLPAVPPDRTGSWPVTEKMTSADWVELKRSFEEINFFQQIKAAQRLGPQGRRKLVAMREGTEGVFIVPGEVVQLLEDTEQFKKSFSRFKPNSLNGFSAAKDARRGQECTITITWNDGTFACRFGDGLVLDFPWESAAGFNMKDSGLAL